MIPEEFNSKRARKHIENFDSDVESHGEMLDKFYADLENVSKSAIVKLCRDTVLQARLCQIYKYASDFASQYEQNVEVNIMVFYINHVILLNCKYYYKTTSFSEYEIFSSGGYFDDEDLKSIQNVTL